MDIDKTSLLDLNIFHPEEEFSIFHRLNFTRTLEGKEWLRHMFSEPFRDLQKIEQTQQVIRLIGQKLDQWPEDITNGTLMVTEKYYSAQMDNIPLDHSFLSALSFKLFHGPDFAIIRFSLTHFADLLRGLKLITGLLEQEELPRDLRMVTDRIQSLTSPEQLQELADHPKGKPFSNSQIIYFGHYLRNRFKTAHEELIDCYGRLDAWYGMAVAMKKFNLQFPEFVESEQPFIRAGGLYHILLPNPVAYNIVLDEQHNFLFLTGANMAGKSTFIKSVGAAVYLAHLGMGVPAQSLRLSLFEGILSNINVTDNIIKGESYFFNEVQRIKNTILKINDGRKWLVLIDELFKGTNVQDAMKCSLTVIEGLIRINHSLFILSTHLYEIGKDLEVYPNIIFRYFETEVKEDQLEFSYQLKEGISNDRLGYLILKKEKVVELLQKIQARPVHLDS
ncbi:DNA mismatch repair protein MutS [Flavihumibacter stibioxidans]|uniref:DNA mismatch repair protein MutS n=1 Tax=Flavihumibacter stibioxidans TaxID=1834163 RepID=A0ABR7M780_9BACT|nr:DNA mismatch repair protein MutS [Flavihumibacter stibioxidans]MBC6490781.1 DNA mismatch repair protein MutS [Flavihumibacter stibioxidans]